LLRDLAAPEFQAKNTSADLALVFAEMRRNNLSLFGVMLLTPQLEAVPEVDAEGRLRLSGFVPSRPLQVKLIWRSRLRLTMEASERCYLYAAGRGIQITGAETCGFGQQGVGATTTNGTESGNTETAAPKLAPTEEEKR